MTLLRVEFCRHWRLVCQIHKPKRRVTVTTNPELAVEHHGLGETNMETNPTLPLEPDGEDLVATSVQVAEPDQNDSRTPEVELEVHREILLERLILEGINHDESEVQDANEDHRTESDMLDAQNNRNQTSEESTNIGSIPNLMRETGPTRPREPVTMPLSTTNDFRYGIDLPSVPHAPPPTPTIDAEVENVALNGELNIELNGETDVEPVVETNTEANVEPDFEPVVGFIEEPIEEPDMDIIHEPIHEPIFEPNAETDMEIDNRDPCTGCLEGTDRADLMTLPCEHRLCISCIVSMFGCAINEESCYPPRCCPLRERQETLSVVSRTSCGAA